MTEWRGVMLVLQLSTLVILDSLTLSAGDWWFQSWYSDRSKYEQEKGFWLSQNQYVFHDIFEAQKGNARYSLYVIRHSLDKVIWNVGRYNYRPFVPAPDYYNPETKMRQLDQMSPPTNFLAVLRAIEDVKAAVEDICKSNSSSPEQRSAILQFKQRYRNNTLIREYRNTYLKNLEDFSPLYWKMVRQEDPNTGIFAFCNDCLRYMVLLANVLEFTFKYVENSTYNATFYDILAANFTRKASFVMDEFCKWRLRVCLRTFARDHLNRFNRINNQSGNTSFYKKLLNEVTADMSTVFSKWYSDYDFVIMLMRDRVTGMNSTLGMVKVAIEIGNTSAVLVYRKRAAETPTNQLSQRKFKELLKHIAGKTYSQVNTGNDISIWISQNARLTFYWMLILREGAAYSVNTTGNMRMLSYFPSLQTQFNQTALRQGESILADFELHIVF